MNLRQLQTLARVLETGSFAAAGDRMRLSHSAVSMQMKELEADLGVALFDRANRPPSLTPEGAAVAAAARDILVRVDHLYTIAAGQDVPARVTVGFVPTTLKEILPRFLSRFRQAFPNVQIRIKSGLSGELAAAVAQRELDCALITSPIQASPDIEIASVAEEPLYVVGPKSLAHIASDAELAQALPFIAFNKRAWLGQQITLRLQSRGIRVTEEMELDSLDSIETLVAEGQGVSVVPQRLLAPPLELTLTRLPFGEPCLSRHLALIRSKSGRRNEVERKIRVILQALADPNLADPNTGVSA